MALGLITWMGNTSVKQYFEKHHLKEDQKLRDDEITGQLATFMFAGSDTTAGTIAFGLHQLALHPSFQTRLRNEILTYGDLLPYDQIETLPYLDAVTKEILRFCPSLPGTIRQAQKNDIIPLSQPVLLTTGEPVSEIKIRKGQLVHIPIEQVNLSPDLWGPTSHRFNPDRFLSLPHHISPTSPTVPNGQGTRTSVGVWPNLLTFLDGPRRCVGYKLALMEIKIMLFTLLREFHFDIVPGITIQRWNMLTSRPFVAGSLRSKGWTLPLLIRPYHGDINVNEKSS